MKASYFSSDSQDFLTCLGKHEAEYLLVGGEAVIYYGFPRLTGDMDIFFRSTIENCTKLYSALLEFWEGNVPGIDHPGELQEPGVIFQFGLPPNRIDLMNRIDGVDFEEAWQNRERVDLEKGNAKTDIYFIGLDQLIKNKEAANRPQDQQDLKYLRKAREERRLRDNR